MYNLFSVGFEALHNLTSGTSVHNELAQSILQVYENGKLKANEFKNSRILSQELKCHVPLKKKMISRHPLKKIQTSVEVNLAPF